MLAQKIIGEFFHRAQIAQIHSANMGAVNNAFQAVCAVSGQRAGTCTYALTQARVVSADAGIAAGHQSIFATRQCRSKPSGSGARPVGFNRVLVCEIDIFPLKMS